MRNVSNGQTGSLPSSPARTKNPQIKVIRECQSQHKLAAPAETLSLDNSQPRPAKTIRRRQTVPNLRSTRDAEANGNTKLFLSRNNFQKPHDSSTSPIKPPSKTTRPSFSPRSKTLSRDRILKRPVLDGLDLPSQISVKLPPDTSKDNESIIPEPVRLVDAAIPAMADTKVTNAKSEIDKEGLKRILDQYDQHCHVPDAKASPSNVEDVIRKFLTACQVSQDTYHTINRTLDTSIASMSIPDLRDNPQSSISQNEKWTEKITIHGLDMGICSPAEFTKPIIRCRPSSSYDGYCVPAATMDTPRQIQCLDIVTKWFGVSQSHADELFRIHTAFGESVKVMLNAQLKLLHSELQGQQALEQTTNSRVFTDSIDRHISFCRGQITDDMAHKLYGTVAQPNIRLVPSGLLAMYLATTDCFFDYTRQHDPRDTSITLRVYYNKANPLHDTFIRSAFTPDVVLFENLNTHPQEGQILMIVPRYQCNSVFRTAESPHELSYKTNVPWLEWDEAIAGFRGLVPYLSITGLGNKPIPRDIDAQNHLVHSLEITVTATMVQSLDGSSGPPLWFERSVNTRLLLSTAPQVAQNDTHHQMNAPLPVNAHFPPIPPNYINPADFEGSVNEVLRILSPTALTAAYNSLFEIGRTRESRLAESDPLSGRKATNPHPQNILQHNHFAAIHLARKHASLAERLYTLAQQHSAAEQQCRSITSSLGAHNPINEHTTITKSPTVPTIVQTDTADLRSFHKGLSSKMSPQGDQNNSGLKPDEDLGTEQRPMVCNPAKDSQTQSFRPMIAPEYGPSKPTTKPPPGLENPCRICLPTPHDSLTKFDAEAEILETTHSRQSVISKKAQDRWLDAGLPCSRDPKTSLSNEAAQEAKYFELPLEESRHAPTTPILQPAKPALCTATPMEAPALIPAKILPRRVAFAPSTSSTVQRKQSNLASSSSVPRTSTCCYASEEKGLQGRHEIDANASSITLQPFKHDQDDESQNSGRAVSESITSLSAETIGSVPCLTRTGHYSEASLNFSNRFAVLAETAEGLESSSEMNDDSEVNVEVTARPAMWDLGAFCLGYENPSSPVLCGSSPKHEQNRSRCSCPNNTVGQVEKGIATACLLQDPFTPPGSEKDDTMSGQQSSNDLGLDEDNLSSTSIVRLMSSFSVEGDSDTEREGVDRKIIMKRPSDGRMMKLACLDCRRTDFTSFLAFLNHCYIQHDRLFVSCHAAVEASSEEIEHCDYSPKCTHRNQLRESRGISPSCDSKIPRCDTDDTHKAIALAVDRKEQGMLGDSMTQTSAEQRSTLHCKLEPRLSKDEERHLQEATKRSLEEQTTRKMTAMGLPYDMDDIFQCSTSSSLDETWSASEGDPLVEKVRPQTLYESESERDDLGLSMEWLYSGTL